MALASSPNVEIAAAQWHAKHFQVGEELVFMIDEMFQVPQQQGEQCLPCRDEHSGDRRARSASVSSAKPSSIWVIYWRMRWRASSIPQWWLTGSSRRRLKCPRRLLCAACSAAQKPARQVKRWPRSRLRCMPDDGSGVDHSGRQSIWSGGICASRCSVRSTCSCNLVRMSVGSPFDVSIW